jgi:hypothetical protein
MTAVEVAALRDAARAAELRRWRLLRRMFGAQCAALRCARAGDTVRAAIWWRRLSLANLARRKITNRAILRQAVRVALAGGAP